MGFNIYMAPNEFHYISSHLNRVNWKNCVINSSYTFQIFSCNDLLRLFSTGIPEMSHYDCFFFLFELRCCAPANIELLINSPTDILKISTLNRIHCFEGDFRSMHQIVSNLLKWF